MKLPTELALWPEGKRHIPSEVVSPSKRELWTVIWHQQLPQEGKQELCFQGFLDAVSLSRRPQSSEEQQPALAV